MHTFPLPKNSTYKWTEWFKAWQVGCYQFDWLTCTQADPAVMHNKDYSRPLAEVKHFMNSPQGVPQSKVAEMDTFFEKLATIEPKKMLFEGMPWGGLQEKLTGKRVAQGCPFPEPKYTPETRAWLDLVANGTFSAATLELTPGNFEVSDSWIALTTKSLETGHNTWLHHLIIGTHALEVGNAELAAFSFSRSVELRPNLHASRNLAVMAANATAASAHFKAAWNSWLDLDMSTDPLAERIGKDFAGEYTVWMLLNDRFDELRSFLHAMEAHQVASKYLIKDKVLHARAGLAVQDKNYKSAIDILTSHCFPTYGNKRSDLIQLWWQAKVLEAEANKGGQPLTKRETLQLRRSLKCDGDYSSNTLNDKCRRGPPNLGYPY